MAKVKTMPRMGLTRLESMAWPEGKTIKKKARLPGTRAPELTDQA